MFTNFPGTTRWTGQALRLVGFGFVTVSPATANGLGGVWNLFSMEGKEGEKWGIKRGEGMANYFQI